jgi:hydrogenase maturation protease
VRILVAGVGNVLRGDDGFGVAVVHHLAEQPTPRGVELLEIGIGGIHLVQALLGGVDALVVVDAVDLGHAPGTVLVQRPEVLDVSLLSDQERRDQLADVHYATPERAFMLARALDVLPVETWVVGCQPVDAERLGEGLSGPVRAAVATAAREVRAVVSSVGVRW